MTNNNVVIAFLHRQLSLKLTPVIIALPEHNIMKEAEILPILSDALNSTSTPVSSFKQIPSMTHEDKGFSGYRNGQVTNSSLIQNNVFIFSK